MKDTRPQTFPAFSNLIGVPYSQKDCWNLAKDFYALVFGVELKKYYESTPDDRYVRENLIRSSAGEFLKVEGSPKFGDLIVLKVRGIEGTIAVYLENDQMLHTSETTGSVIERVSRWKNTIAGYYRLPGAAND